MIKDVDMGKLSCTIEMNNPNPLYKREAELGLIKWIIQCEDRAERDLKMLHCWP